MNTIAKMALAASAAARLLCPPMQAIRMRLARSSARASIPVKGPQSVKQQRAPAQARIPVRDTAG